MPIKVIKGQSITLLLEFFQAGEDGPRLDLTSAVIAVEDTNLLTMTPLLAISDAVQGEITVFIADEDTRKMSLSRPTWLQVRVELPSGEVRVTPKIEMQAQL